MECQRKYYKEKIWKLEKTNKKLEVVYREKNVNLVYTTLQNYAYQAMIHRLQTGDTSQSIGKHLSHLKMDEIGDSNNHVDQITDYSVISDQYQNRMLLSVSKDNVLSLTDIFRQRSLLSLDQKESDKYNVQNTHLSLRSVAHLGSPSRDSLRIATGGYDKYLKIWKVDTKKNKIQMLRSVLAHQGPVKQLESLNDRLFSLQGNTVKQWDPELLAFPTNMIKLPQNNVHHMSLDSSSIAYAADDNSVNTYDLETGSLSRQMSLAHLKSINKVYFTSSSSLLSCSNDGSAKLWDLRAKKQCAQEYKYNKESMVDVQVVGDSVVGINTNRQMLFWDSKMGGGPKSIVASQRGFNHFSKIGKVEELKYLTVSAGHSKTGFSIKQFLL